MTDDERWGVFEEYLRNTCECDFVFFWARGVAKNLFEIPVTVQRRGLPKSGPRPMVRYRELLALLMGVGLRYGGLQGYAVVSGTSYGLLRIWHADKRVKLRALEYRRDLEDAFAAAFIRAAAGRDDVLVKQLLLQARLFPPKVV